MDVKKQTLKYQPGGGAGVALYILRRKLAIRCMSVEAWSRWMSSHRQERIVARDRLCDPDYQDVTVSTVFLGVDANHGLGQSPILFETMFFGGELNHEVFARYATWEEAEAGHRRAVEVAIKELQEIRGRAPVICSQEESCVE